MYFVTLYIINKINKYNLISYKLRIEKGSDKW